MAFKIEDIRQGLKLGGARPTLFEVHLTFPGMVPGSRTAGDKARFLVTASAIPGSSIASIEVPYFGRKIRVAGDRTFQPWSVSVLNDEDFAVREALENWHNKMNSLERNINTTGSQSPELYKKDAEVWQYSKSDSKGGGTTPIRKYKFIGLFPTEISPIDLDWNATDTIESFQVQFAYDYYEIIPENGSAIK